MVLGQSWISKTEDLRIGLFEEKKFIQADPEIIIPTQYILYTADIQVQIPNHT